MYDAVCNIIITLVNGFVSVVNSAWTTIAPPGGVIEGTWDYLNTLNDWLPISDGFVILGILGSMALFSGVLKFGQKLLDWLPKGA